MRASNAQKLLNLNHVFYSEFGAAFSVTRQRLQPGVRKILIEFAVSGNILDLGCGNGEIVHFLVETGFKGAYTGLDFSPPLLGDARARAAGFHTAFVESDLTSPHWDQPLVTGSYSLITAFAVLHHIPSIELRQQIVQKVRRLLAPGGKFIHSNWQFLNSEKLKGRIQPWASAGLSIEDVDDGDYLLDWRSGGSGLRYAHHFSEQELNRLASDTGFKVSGSFLSDGAGERLGLYQVWDLAEDLR